MSTTFGLDVGRRSVKLVRIEGARQPGEPPRSVRGVSRDVDPALEGDARRAAVVAAIRECAAEAGAAGREVAVAVPRSEAVVKTVHLPPVSVEERAKLIGFQAAKDVPFELKDIVLASGVVGAATQGSTEVIYAAVRTTVLEGLRSMVQEAGLHPGVLEVSTQAAARAVRLLMPDTPDVVLVQIGALATDISILQDGRLTFSRSASVGPGRTTAETGAAEVDLWLERLVAEVQRSLRAAEPGQHGPRVLLVAGGGARSESVVATLAARLGLPAKVADPLGSGRSPEFLVARGLADRRPVGGIPVLDLAGRADAEQALSKRRRAAALGALLVALLGTTGLLLHKEIVDREAAADRIDADLRELGPRVNELRVIEKEVLTAQGWKARKGRSLDVLLAISSALPRDEAYLRRFSWSEGHTVLLTGRARDSEAIERFLRRLNRDSLIERATPDAITRPEREKDAESKGSDFAITIKLRDLPARAGEEKRQ